MPRLKTQEEYIADLKAKNVTHVPIEKYVGARSSILHQCGNCSRTWKAEPRRLLEGRACPCKAGNTPKSNSDYVSFLEKHTSLVNLTPYVNAKTAIKHLCKICLGVYEIAPNSIQQHPNYCPRCNGKHQRTPAEYLEELMPLGVEPLEDFKGVHTPILHKGVCGHEWKCAPNNILSSGTRCPHCSNRGVQNPLIPGFLYFFSFHYEERILYKIGITINSVERRHAGSWKKLNCSLLWIKPFSTMFEAKQAEQKILLANEDNRVHGIAPLYNGGNTELLSIFIAEPN